MNRCRWVKLDNPLYVKYHDEEWGVPMHDDRDLFEMLILEGAQAGLSWETVLNKRENYRKAFAAFDPKKVARFDEAKIQKLMGNEGIIRNQLKIRSTVTNAQAFLALQKELGSFSDYLWSFVGGKTIVRNAGPRSAPVAQTKQSDAMSQDLKKKSFKFVGSTICYAFMQATGMVNDHATDCFRFRAV